MSVSLQRDQGFYSLYASYLLSPQTFPLGGLGSHPRLTLLGSPSPSVSAMYYKDPDPIILSEIAEFAMSLATPAKGQEPFAGLPHLQPYRLLRATCLAEIGHVQLANRYVHCSPCSTWADYSDADTVRLSQAASTVVLHTST